ncbi:MAG TPA: hypothetical protein VNG12_13465 [Acidimicrobiales bacterium]|nr:hypothetical protein [Acidimicrobiales bacterium]
MSPPVAQRRDEWRSQEKAAFPPESRRRRVIGVVAGTARSRRRLRLGPCLVVVAVAGKVAVDLSEATFEAETLQLIVIAAAGVVDVVLPPVVPVRLRRLALGRISADPGAEIRHLTTLRR